MKQSLQYKAVFGLAKAKMLIKPESRLARQQNDAKLLQVTL